MVQGNIKNICGGYATTWTPSESNVKIVQDSTEEYGFRSGNGFAYNMLA
jgi:hypothetical protein